MKTIYLWVSTVAFEQSNAVFDFGYTQGYKETSATKIWRQPISLENLQKYFLTMINQIQLKIKTQNVSDDKYLKLYRIKSDIVDYNQNNIENSQVFHKV